MKISSRFVIAALMLAGASSVASANPLPIGSLTGIVFDDGGTVTGSFTLDATGTILTGYSFTTSAWATGGLGAFTYDTTDSIATWSQFTPGQTASGPAVGYLDIRSPDNLSRPRHNLFLAFYNTGLVDGANVGLCDIDAGACLTDGPLSIQVQSGEQFLDASNNAISRAVQHGSLDISDPPGAFTLNSNELQSGGGGPVTSVPEPSSVALLGLGIVGLGLVRRNRIAAI